MAHGSRELTAFQRRAAEIEAMFQAGEIGPETRRALLERARNTSGIAKAVLRDRPANAPVGKLLAMSDHQINAAKRAGRTRHDQRKG